MANLMRCKACGYVTDQGNIKDVCPACGVPAKMFEPYNHPVSLKRRRILDLHTHPVMVHFPQAFALTLFILSCFAFFVPQSLMETLSYDDKNPVGAAAVSFDTRHSHRSDGRQIKISKSHNASAKKKNHPEPDFFITAVVMAALVLSGQLLNTPTHMIYFALTIIVSLCGALLGLIGGKLLDAKFPG